MRNKKISKLVDPSFRLYFLVGFLFAAVTVRVSIPLAICEAAAMAFLWWYFRHTAQKRREGIRQYIELALRGDDTIDTRLKMFTHQRDVLLAQMEEMRHTLETVEYKCWFYEVL